MAQILSAGGVKPSQWRVRRDRVGEEWDWFWDRALGVVVWSGDLLYPDNGHATPQGGGFFTYEQDSYVPAQDTPAEGQTLIARWRWDVQPPDYEGVFYEFFNTCGDNQFLGFQKGDASNFDIWGMARHNGSCGQTTVGTVPSYPYERTWSISHDNTNFNVYEEGILVEGPTAVVGSALDQDSRKRLQAPEAENTGTQVKFAYLLRGAISADRHRQLALRPYGPVRPASRTIARVPAAAPAGTEFPFRRYYQSGVI